MKNVGMNLQGVDCVKYLGVNFNFRGKFSKWGKELNNQSIRAIYSVISKARPLGLLIDIHLDLFDNRYCRC